MRRGLLALCTAGLVAAGCGGGPSGPPPPAPAANAGPFSVVETDIPSLQQALQSGRVTSRQLTELYLARIAIYEDRVNAIITVNPRALDEADAMDHERAAGRLRGPLHGIPIALKDNVHTTDIRTTGGALAFRDLMPPYDATLTKNLRDGGAIIIAKTVLTELAHWTAGAPTPMVANYTGVAGFAFNPYDPRLDPRAETFAAGRCSPPAARARAQAPPPASGPPASARTPADRSSARRTPTCSPASGPTIGRISRYGVIPITADHDTAGPMARTVTDAAILMGVLESAAPDPNDAGDEGVHAAAESGLHRVPRRWSPQGRAHRHPARVLLRPRQGARRRVPARFQGRAWRTQRRAGEGDGGGVALLKPRAPRSSIRWRCRASSATDRGRRTSCCSTTARARSTRRAATPTAP